MSCVLADEQELASWGRAFPAEPAAEGSWRPLCVVELEEGKGDGRETLRIVGGLECRTKSWDFILQGVGAVGRSRGKMDRRGEELGCSFAGSGNLSRFTAGRVITFSNVRTERTLRGPTSSAPLYV